MYSYFGDTTLGSGFKGSKFQRHFISARVRDCPNARQTKQHRVAASGQCPAGSHASPCIMNATLRISQQEWLEADGLGGFASGTSTGIRTRSEEHTSELQSQ